MLALTPRSARDSLLAHLLVVEEALVLHQLLRQHEVLRLVEGALARRGVEVVRRLVLGSSVHGLASSSVLLVVFGGNGLNGFNGFNSFNGAGVVGRGKGGRCV